MCVYVCVRVYVCTCVCVCVYPYARVRVCVSRGIIAYESRYSYNTHILRALLESKFNHLNIEYRFTVRFCEVIIYTETKGQDERKRV